MTLQSEAFLNTVELTAEHRCDRCTASAWMVASKGIMQLFFCGHHGKMHYHVLLNDGWSIQDDSNRLNPNKASV